MAKLIKLAKMVGVMHEADHAYSLWWQGLKCLTFLASKLDHFENDIHFCQDIISLMARFEVSNLFSL